MAASNLHPGDLEVLLHSVDLTLTNHDGPYNFLEIGSHKGQTSSLIIDHLEKTNTDFHYYGIDPQIIAPMGGFWKMDFTHDKFTWLKGFSFEEEIINKIPNLHWIFLDACHCKLCVKRDIENYFPKLISNGIICIHDAVEIIQNRRNQRYEALKEHHDDELAGTEGVQVLAAIEEVDVNWKLYKKAAEQRWGGVQVYFKK